MHCQTCQDQLPAFLLGEISGIEASEIEVHLKTCEACCSELADLVEASDQLMSAATTEYEPDDLGYHRQSVWERVAERIDSQEDVTIRVESMVADAPLQRLRPLAVTLLAMACGFFAVTGVRFLIDSSPQPAGAKRFGADATDPANPALRTASLHQPQDPQLRYGTIVFDSIASQIHVYLTDAPRLGKNERLVFWFYTSDGAWVMGDELIVDGGRTAQLIELPLLPAALVSTAITIESSDDASQPSDNIAIVSDSFEGA